MFKKKTIKLQKGVNLIFGPNGSGKTTTLEAIHLLSLGKSFKSSTPKHYIQKTKEQYNVQAKTNTNNTIEIKGDLYKKTIYVDGSLVKKISDHIVFLPTITHTPEEAVLETKINQNRNTAINKNICFYSKKYLKNIQEYNLILKQRNEALKQKQPTKIWDSFFIEKAEKLWIEKTNYEREINKKITETQKESRGVKIKIQGTLFNKDSIKKKLEEIQEKDYKRGYTGIGPHKDQIKYFFNKEEVKISASQGEKTTFFTILKKAEAKHISLKLSLKGEEEKLKEPVILLDDILSKLDKENTEKTLNLFKNNKQTIITHTEKIQSLKINQININD